jgi:hypothetical protein
MPFLVLGLGFVVAAGTLAATTSSTKGRIPDEAFLPSGALDADLVPDFVAVWNEDVLAGYVRRAVILEPSFDDAKWPVYGDDLRTLVGYMVAGKGFAPIGVDPATLKAAPFSEGPALLPGQESSR